MKSNIPRAAALLFPAAALLFASCAKREKAVEAGIRTQTLHIGNTNEPRDLDPHVLTAASDLNIVIQLMEGLTSTDPTDGHPVPGVAEQWKTSDGQLTWTFHLRANARWSNGDLVTAGDFATGIQRALSPALGAEYASLLYCLKNAEEVKTPAFAGPPRGKPRGIMAQRPLRGSASV